MKSIAFIAALALVLGAPPARCQETSARDTVNVTITKQRKMLVEAWVNGSNGTFLVDTGAGNSYLGERFADSMGLQRDQGGYSYNVLGSMRFDVADIDNLELGRNRVPLRHSLMHISNLGWANQGRTGDGSAIHGIIGADILIHNGAVIDCSRSWIRFGSSGARVGHGGASPKITVNFIYRRGDELAVVARINGTEGLFIVDTGYNVSMVSPEFLYRLNATGAGGAGGSGSRVIGIKSMELGANKIPVSHDQMLVTSRVSVANQGYMDLGEAPYDGVLGMDFLMNHHAVIDCGRKQLHID